jgi:5-formyltetrahydrofolate cyclo-ligase
MGEDRDRAKRDLRGQLRKFGRQLARRQLTQPSTIACGRIVESAAFGAATHVVLYAARGVEVDPLLLEGAALTSGKAVYYPRATADGLEFLATRHADLRSGRFGIPEPAAGEPLMSDRTGVLFVVPGVAFDLSGSRLGRGTGYYDRALIRYPAAVRIGLAYEFQLLPALPTSPADVPMHMIATDARLLTSPTGPRRRETPL